MAQKLGRREAVVVRFPPDIRCRLADLAKARGISRQDLIVAVCTAELKHAADCGQPFARALVQSFDASAFE